MKKLISIGLVFVLVFSTLTAFAENYMPKEVKITIEETTNHAMVILDENRELVSIKNMTERMKYLPCVYSYSYGTYVRGIMNNGTIIRGAHGLASLTKIGDYYFGLTPVDIEVTIFEECKPLVQNIILNLVGTNEITNVTVIAASIWLENSRGAHIFYDEITRREHVGNACIVNQNAWFEIWAGDINLNDELEIGFIPSGGCPATKPEPEPDSESTPEPESEEEPSPTPTPENSDPNNEVKVNIDTSTKTEIKVKTNSNSCTTNNITINTGNGNNTTNTNTKVNGNNNTTTTVNNTSTTFSLFAITLNENSNNTNVVTNVNTGVQVITKPTLKIDSLPKNPNQHCG